ncbi:MAG: hypothetical protein KDJ69_11955 [Nitratireductor sp.]|nr:hypothetical protein [Nitratireductor sp.]
MQEETENKLRSWILAHADVEEVIVDHPGGSRPDGAYIMINLLRSDRIQLPMGRSFAEIDEPGDGPAFKHNLAGEWQWDFSVNAYAQNATDLLAALKVAGEMNEVEFDLYPLILFASGTVIRLPELINERWEERAQMDVSLRGYINTLGVLVDSIEQVDPEFTRTGSSAGDVTETLTVIKP